MKKVLSMFLIIFTLIVMMGFAENTVNAEDFVGYAYAVLTAEGDLVFFRSNTVYEEGKQTVIDINQNEYTGTVFPGIESNSFSHSWDEYANKIRKVYVADDQIICLPEGMKFSNLTRLISFEGTGFDTSRTSSMSYMFSGCSNLTSIDLSGLDTRAVTNMSYMFSGCSNLTSIDLSGFDTSLVTNMSYMFYGCSSLTSIDLSVLDTSNVVSVNNMFSGCSNLTSLNLSTLNLYKVTDTGSLFSGCNKLASIDLSRSIIATVSNLFSGCSGLTSIDLSYSKIEAMADLFSGCSSLKSVNLKGLDTSSVSSMYRAFYGCSSLTSVDLSTLDTSKVTNMGSMFSGCSSLTLVKLNGIDTGKVTTMSGMFNGCSSLTSVDLSSLDTSKVTSMYGMFSGCSSLVSLDLAVLNTSSVKSMSYMFARCSRMKSIDLHTLDTSSVTNMSYMFSGCSSLTSIDLAGLDTGLVTDMSYMFSGCSGLPSLDSAKLDTSSVTNMSYMFSGCSSLKSLDLGVLDTSKVTTMNGLLSGCSQLSALNLKKINTGNVTTVSNMFSGCSRLTTIDLKSLNTSKVTNMSYMLSGCSGLTVLDLSALDTGSVTNMSYMFSGCSSLTELDLKGLDTSSVTNMNGLFSGCSGLITLDLSNFDTYSTVEMVDMFLNCTCLSDVVIGQWFDKWGSYLPGDDLWDHEGILKTPKEIAEGFAINATEWAGRWERIRTYAVLTESGDLVFLNSKQSVKNNTEGQIEDLSGNLFTGTVFTYPNSISEWRYASGISWNAKKDSIKSVSVANGNTIKPVYLDNWFQDCSSLESFDSTGFDPSNTTITSGLFSGCNNLMRIVLGPLFEKGDITIPGDDPWEYKGLQKTSKELSAEYPSHNTEWTGLWERIRNYAVLTKAGDLVFLNSKKIYSNKSENLVEDIKGNSYKGTVYSYVSGISEWKAVAGTSWDSPEWLIMASNDSDVPWSGEKDIIKRVYVANGSTIKPVYFYWWFADCHSLKEFDGSGFDTSSVTDMSGLFYDCSSLESFDGSGFDTSLVTNMSDMFSGCYSLMRVVISPYSTWNALLPGEDTWEHDGIRKTPLQISREFRSHAIEWAGTWDRIRTYAILTKSGDLVFLNSKEYHSNQTEAQVKDINGHKYTGTVYSYVNGISEWGNQEDMTPTGVPWDSVRSRVKNVFVSSGSIVRPRHMYEWFKDFTSLKTFDASGFDTSNVYNMAYLFNGCSSLTTLDLSNFETSSANYMYGMFTGCRSLLSLDISGFDTGSDIYLYDCVNLLSITLGNKIRTDFWLPPKDSNTGYYWTNGDLTKTSLELDRQYAQHSSEWAGTWKRVLYPVTSTTAINYGTGILVKWNQVKMVSGSEEEKPTGYVIYRRAMKAGSTEWSAFARWSNTTDLSFLDTKVYEGTKYQYGIKAYYGNDPSTTKWLGPVGPMTTAVVYSKKPAAPTKTTTKNTNDGIEITWDAVKGATGYVIYRRAWSSTTNGWTDFQRWNNTKSTIWTDTKVYAGTKYQYGIKAYYGDDPKNMTYVGDVGPLSTNVRITTRTITHASIFEYGGSDFTTKATVIYDGSSLFTGYQLQFAEESDSGEGLFDVADKTMIITVSDPKTTKLTVEYDWNEHSFLYVRVRSYHEYNGIRYYGAWSKEMCMR